MYETVCARFKLMNIPAFPTARFLTLWGGLQHGFWAFSHNPSVYAKKVNCPVLLFWGEKDDKVSKIEITKLYQNLANTSQSQLVKLANAGHENYLLKNEIKWTKTTLNFLN